MTRSEDTEYALALSRQGYTWEEIEDILAAYNDLTRTHKTALTDLTNVQLEEVTEHGAADPGSG